MRKVFLGVLIVFVAVAILFAITGGIIRAQSENETGDPDTIKKLDDILKGQKDILDGIASIKEELGVIKIRITQQQ